MSTLHKVKAYFGMAPMEDYDDEYYEDRTPSRGYSRPRFDDGYGRYEGRDYEDPGPARELRGDPRGEMREPADYPPPVVIAAAMATSRRFRAREFDRAEMSRPRFGSWLRNSRPAARWRWIRAGWR